MNAIACVTDPVLVISERPENFRLEERYGLALMRGDPVPLKGDSRIAATIEQSFELVRDDREDYGPFRVSTRAYQYAVEEREGPEIITYHWHPEGLSSEDAPHLHLKSGAKVGRVELTRTKGESAHIPTGRVALEEFLRLLIECFGVPPRKSDWRQVLRGTKEDFDRYRNW